MKAVVGGSGLYAWPEATLLESVTTSTRWGDASIDVYRHESMEFLFLPRHGGDHSLAPHAINYRANMAALAERGAKAVVAVNAVGGIASDLPAGSLCVPDQLIDYTWGRAHSYCEPGEPVAHVDFTVPYESKLRRQLLQQAEAAGVACRDGGCYAATQGPRLETAAEIGRLQRDGCDVVGMTGMPEAGLARELALPYASLCLVVNPAAGHGDGAITMAEIDAQLHKGMETVRSVLLRWLVA